jgi:large subunit ribosomal protein L24e
MVEQKICSFCGESIEPGTGRLYVRKDGFTYSFCSNKCFKNMIVLGRAPRETRWTSQYRRDKAVRLAVGTHAGKEGAKKTIRVRKVAKAGKQEVAKQGLEQHEAEERARTPSAEQELAKKDAGDGS